MSLLSGIFIWLMLCRWKQNLIQCSSALLAIYNHTIMQSYSTIIIIYNHMANLFSNMLFWSKLKIVNLKNVNRDQKFADIAKLWKKYLNKMKIAIASVDSLWFLYIRDAYFWLLFYCSYHIYHLPYSCVRMTPDQFSWHLYRL